MFLPRNAHIYITYGAENIYKSIWKMCYLLQKKLNERWQMVDQLVFTHIFWKRGYLIQYSDCQQARLGYDWKREQTIPSFRSTQTGSSVHPNSLPVGNDGSPGVEWPVCEGDYPCLSRTEIKRGWRYKFRTSLRDTVILTSLFTFET